MLPTPTHALDDSCSTLYNNTLYTYTNEAFQSLPLRHGAQWSELSMGVAVTGGVCVKSTPKNDTSAAALYIVGGVSNQSDYSGLQRYTFANASWETLTPSVAVTKNRISHAAVYLNTSDSILVYSGTQDGSEQLSSQTFTIQSSPPHTVLAYESIAPPAISPILIPWTESKAVYIGGSTTNTNVMVFSPTTSWIDSNATLATGIYDASVIKAVVINGDDGSKSLYTFDTSVSPNEVNRTVLIDADGNPVKNAAPIVGSGKRWEDSGFNTRSSELQERNLLTVSDWPTYNNTLAPHYTRTKPSIARDQSGLVVISGGSSTDVLCMFKARDNTWINASTLLDSNAVITTTTSSRGDGSSSTSASTTATAAATTTAAASKDTDDAPFPTKVLGAVLGSILAVAFILIAFLVIFRWRKNKRRHTEAGHQRRSSGLPDEKNGLDFVDNGMPQMVTTRQFPNHQQQHSHESVSSMAILMGRVGHKRGDESNNRSGSSSQHNQQYKAAISKPMQTQESRPYVPSPNPSNQPLAEPSRDEKAVSFAAKDPVVAGEREPMPRPRESQKGARRGSTRRSSGWNRYWSGGSSLNILGFGSGNKRVSDAESEQNSNSEYSAARMPSQFTQASALVPPLKAGDRPELNRVNTASPTISHQDKFPITRPMSGQVERIPSFTSSVSSNDDYDPWNPFSDDSHASGYEERAWAPVGGWGEDQERTSNYSESMYTNTLPRSTINYQRETRFPGPGFPPPPRPAPPPQDMSWLNLGNSDTRI